MRDVRPLQGARDAGPDRVGPRPEAAARTGGHGGPGRRGARHQRRQGTRPLRAAPPLRHADANAFPVRSTGRREGGEGFPPR